jgi:hypothetical protein
MTRCPLYTAVMHSVEERSRRTGCEAREPRRDRMARCRSLVLLGNWALTLDNGGGKVVRQSGTAKRLLLHELARNVPCRQCGCRFREVSCRREPTWKWISFCAVCGVFVLPSRGRKPESTRNDQRTAASATTAAAGRPVRRREGQDGDGDRRRTASQCRRY